MKKFRDLMEAKDTVVFAYGRFNPPTTGHEKLIEKVVSVAGTNDYRIYPSHSQNPKRDPLPQVLKTAYMRKMFKKYARNIIVTKSKNAIEIAVELYDQGYKNLVMVAGSDRVKVFDTMLNNYNGVEGKGHGYYKFDSIEIVSAGERDPDSEGVEGMSASKMRVAASDGDMESFLQGVPSGFSDGKKLYRNVRKYMGIREEREMGDMNNYDEMRDAYLTGKIWNAGDIVEANGLIGEIVRKGTNYLSFMSEDGKVHKAWLHEIELDEKKEYYAIATKSAKAKSGWRRVPDTRFETEKSAQAYGMKYHTDKYGAKMFKVVTFKEESELDERNYRKEYDNYHAQPEQREKNAARLRARRLMVKNGKVKPFDDMDVHHKDNNPLNNEEENLKVTTKKWNRTEPRLREGPEEIKKLEKMLKDLEKKKKKTPGDGFAKIRIRELIADLKSKKEEIDLDEDASVYKKTARKNKNDVTYAFGRTKKLDGQPKEKGGYWVWKLSQNYDGKVKGGIRSSWSYVAKDLSYSDAVKLMNKKLGRKEFKEEVELDEMSWYKELIVKISQMKHPTGYEKMAKAYAAKMREKEYKGKPGLAISDIAKLTKNIGPRELATYINKLVDKGIFPKELKAEYVPEMSFKDLVQQIQERELTDTEQKRREEIAKGMSDKDFKKKYGDRWKEVKMAVATNMAKKESLKT